VEPESAVVDEGGLAGACWGLPYPPEWYGEVDPWQVSIGGTGLVRCTPAVSVSSTASETTWSMSPPSEFQREPGNYRPVRSVTLFELLFHPPFLLFVDPLRKLRLIVCLLGKAVYVSRIAFAPYLSP